MKPQFVTAIYTDLEGTRFNGNTSTLYDRYKNSLKSLADGGYSIVCYTSRYHLSDLAKFFEDCPNVRLVAEELTENYYHYDIEAIKDLKPKYIQDTSWRSRCVEIMWGKFYWLWKNISELEADESLFWIDAGLFHGGLISNNFRSPDSKNFYDFDLITQKRNLHQDLCRFTEDKVLNISYSRINHGDEDFQAVYQYRPSYSVVGGIFGGKRDQLLTYLAKATLHMQFVVDHKRLMKEEEIMFHMNFREPDLYKVFTFNNWYHEDWEKMYNPNSDTSFSDFFKVIRE